MKSLPSIMVAPNGATRSKADHPALPVTIDEIISCAGESYQAGAGAIHFHLRDENQRHILDAQACQEALKRLKDKVPEILPQVTSEAAGIYTAPEQIAFIQKLKPEFVSIGLREIERLDDENALSDFYHWLADEGIWVQHILYDVADFECLEDYTARDVIKESETLLFVCGRYSAGQNSSPSDLEPYLEALKASPNTYDWAVCAFGQGETETLKAAQKAGGKIRVGFENSLWNADGSIARDNAERVRSVQI